MASVSELGLSDSDERVLRFAALHGVITPEQAPVLLSAGEDVTGGLLARLEGAGLVRARRAGPVSPVSFTITAAGLAAVGADRLRAGRGAWMRRAVALGWLWLAAKRERLGPGEVLTGQELRAQDARAGGWEGPGSPEVGSGWTPPAEGALGFRVDLGGGSALHYPDLALMDERGWTAVELVLAPWSGRLRGMLLSAYAADERVRRMVLAVNEPGVARAIVLSPFAFGLRGRLEVYSLAANVMLTAGG